MLHGDVLKGGWNDEHVKEALDLCLACKGCKGDCPVNVDMATYKSEFLSHYYEENSRPITAYVFGWIYWWSKIASKMPGVVNFLMHAPVIRNITKAITGIAQERKMPKYAERTFRNWFIERKKKHATNERITGNGTQNSKDKTQNSKHVILWVDTFNNNFLPQTLVAGVEVLEAAGFSVTIPRKSLCCGRPLYDFGMLGTAKKMLVEIMETLHEEIKNGIPIVGLEPSCVAVFRDELHNMFPHDEQATRLSKQVFTLGEFLEKKATGFEIPELHRQAIVHGHCHHKSIMGMDCEKTILKKTKLDYNILPTTCCGMAGYFGYEKGKHYEVSIAAGEQTLLPAVRNARTDSIIIADGFSCREQIEQETDRKGMHLAQVLQMALREKDGYKTDILPEKRYVDAMALKNPNRTRNNLLFGAAAIAAVAIILLKRRSRN